MVWEFGGRGGENFEIKKEQVEKNRGQWDERVLEVNFLFMLQNPPHLGNSNLHHLENSKIVLGEGFEGIGGFM